MSSEQARLRVNYGLQCGGQNSQGRQCPNQCSRGLFHQRFEAVFFWYQVEFPSEVPHISCAKYSDELLHILQLYSLRLRTDYVPLCIARTTLRRSGGAFC